MATRYRADFTSLENIEYRIDIIDTDYEGAILDFEIGTNDLDGFSLHHEGQNQERHNPIISTNATINMLIKSTDQAFLDDLLTISEDRFFIVIKEKTGGTFKSIFAGEIDPFMIDVEDLDYPYMIILTAYDTLSTLKNVEFPAPGPNDLKFTEILKIIIEKTRIYDYLREDFLLTSVQWYEPLMFTGSTPPDALDPLERTRVKRKTFIGNDGRYMSCWKVLEQVCYRWGARFFISEGAFWFQQWNQPEINIPLRIYDKTNFTGTYESRLVKISVPRRIDGVYNFTQILGKAEVAYNYKTGDTPSNLLPDPIGGKYETQAFFGNLLGGNDEHLLFSGTVNLSVQLFDTFQQGSYQHHWRFHLKIQVGPYYLTNGPNNTYTWSTSTSARVLVISPTYNLPAYGYNASFPVSFNTPAVPELPPYSPDSVEGYFQFEHISITSLDGQTFTFPVAHTAEYTISNFILRLIYEGSSLDSGTVQYTQLNDDFTNRSNLDSVKLPDLVTGDGPAFYSMGQLYVYDASTSSWVVSTEWGIDGEEPLMPINNLLLYEIMSGQNRNLRVLRGRVYTNEMGFHKQIMIAGKRYHWRGGTFNANFGTYDGEWVELSYYNPGEIGIIVPEPPINERGLGSGFLIGQLLPEMREIEISAANSATQAALSESEAGNHAGDSLTYRNQAQTARDAAEGHADDAADAKDLAKAYAEEDEDVEVEEGTYSAKHWAMKAQQASV